MSFQSTRFSVRYAAWVAVICVSFTAACADPVVTARGRSADPDAAVVLAARSSIVASPATWHNLWGSWPAARYEFGVAYDSDRQEIVVQGGRLNTTGDAGGDRAVRCCGDDVSHRRHRDV